ncbi:DUF6221 family protein [Streptomyces sp. NPDC044948]|uniref:DUF6221 family protein n=1 Tax=Streptomyces sp. NPDC044948 TaxID=3157092 RepID=UPI0033F36D92
MTDDLVAFLRARLDEDERVAKGPVEGIREWHSPAMRVVMAKGFDDSDPVDVSLKTILERDFSMMPFGVVAVTDYDADAKFIARFDQARVLADVEAKRQLLDLHAPGETEYVDGNVCMACDVRGGEPFYPCKTLRLLALPYAGHPDYRPEWRP